MAVTGPDAADAPHAGARGAGTLVALGAEADVRQARFLGKAVLEKRRLPKGYRHPALDAALRAHRTRDEAGLLVAARKAGVPVPLVYDVDRAQATLRLEPIVGPTLREALAAESDEGRLRLMRHLGAVVARLHDAELTHGDLTTGNVLVPTPVAGPLARDGLESDALVPEALAGAPPLVLIDFGLGLASAEAEPRGVDLHLLEEALEATQPDAAPLFAAFLQAYRDAARGATATLARLDAIRERGRNR